MKRIHTYIDIFLLTLMATAMNSCSKTIVDAPPAEGYRISFDRVETRAEITDSNLAEFNVWGETVTGTADVFNGTLVSGTVPDASGKMTQWTPDVDAYWEENKIYSFFAISPVELKSTVAYQESNGWGIEYDIVGSMVADDQVDFILAQAQRTTGTISEVPDKVHLSFAHKLSKIKLKLKKSPDNDGQEIKLKEVYLYGMKGNGIYYLNSGWSLRADVATVSRTNMEVVLGKDSYSEIGESLMIPQELSENSVYLIASFDYTNDGVKTPRVQVAPIPISTVDEWEESKTYTYTAVLSVEHDIVFEGPTIQNWLSHSEGGTIIIK